MRLCCVSTGACAGDVVGADAQALHRKQRCFKARTFLERDGKLNDKASTNLRVHVACVLVHMHIAYKLNMI